MSHYRILTAVVLPIISALAGAQSSSTSDSAPTLPTGLRIPAILKSNLYSKKSKVGDPIRMDVMADVHGKDGKVVLPRHATLTGEVTCAIPHSKTQAAMLSFSVDHAEWRGHTANLDAAVFGAYAEATDSKKGETVEGIAAATLRSTDALNIVNSTLMYDFRADAGPQVLHDDTLHSVVMQLKIVPDPVVRTAFVNEKDDIELHSFLLVMLNGMKVVQ